MAKLVVRLIGSSIGITAGAIHAARNRSSNKGLAPKSSTPHNSPTEQNGQYVVADEDTANALIHEGLAELPASNESSIHEQYAELPAFYESSIHEQYVELPAFSDEGHESKPIELDCPVDEKGRSMTVETGYGSDRYSESNSSDDMQRGVVQDEDVWTPDETAQHARLPTYEESEWAPVAFLETEETNDEHEENMVRNLVQMAGPVKPLPKIPCPVVIPQRRFRKRSHGFVRAYAPVLADCDICQDTFLKFQEDFDRINMVSNVEVVSVAADIPSRIPEMAAFVTGLIVEVVAGAAREMQSRCRANTFLDRVNQELFMPRGLYAMVMQFKDEVPGQQHGTLGMLSEKLGKTIFATENIDINLSASKPKFNPSQTVARNTNTDEYLEINKVNKSSRNLRSTSGKTYGQIELPDTAPLVFPDLVRGPTQMAGGKGDEPERMCEKLKSAGVWVQDYMDRRAQASYAIRDPRSSLATLESRHKGFTSCCNDPNHPANNRKLLSVLSAGRLGNRPGLIERAATSIKESQDSKRIDRGGPLSEPIREKWRRPYDKKRPGLVKKVLEPDVPYLMIVNMPSEEELQQSGARLETILQQTGQRVSP